MRSFLISLSVTFIFAQSSNAGVFDWFRERLTQPDVVNTATREVDVKTEKTVAAFDASIKAYSIKKNRLDAEVSGVEKVTTSLNGKLTKVNKGYETDKGSLLEAGGTQNSDGGISLDTAKVVQPKVRRITESFENKKKTIAELEQEAFANRQKLIEISAERDAAEAAHRAEQDRYLAELETLSTHRSLALISDEVDTLHKKIRISNAFASITSLQGGTISAAEKLFQLEKVVDESLTGTYMREKMTKLLVSDAFCKAKNACSPAGKSTLTKEDFDEDLDKVFYENGRKLLEKSTKSSTGAK